MRPRNRSVTRSASAWSTRAGAKPPMPSLRAFRSRPGGRDARWRSTATTLRCSERSSCREEQPRPRVSLSARFTRPRAMWRDARATAWPCAASTAWMLPTLRRMRNRLVRRARKKRNVANKRRFCELISAGGRLLVLLKRLVRARPAFHRDVFGRLLLVTGRGNLAEARAYHVDKALHEDSVRHFGFAHAPIHKDDRDLHNLKALPLSPVGHLDLEAIALRANRLELDALQHRAPVATVAGGAIPNLQAQHRAGKNVAAPADKAPKKRPVGRAPSRNIAGADHQVGLLNLFQEIGQIARIMRKIGVHLKGGIIAIRKGVLEASDIRRTQAKFAAAMQDMHARILRAHFLRQFSGAVGRMIIDDQNIGCGRVRENLLEQRGQILQLVVCWNDDQGFHKQLSPYDKLRACMSLSHEHGLSPRRPPCRVFWLIKNILKGLWEEAAKRSPWESNTQAMYSRLLFLVTTRAVKRSQTQAQKRTV